MKKNLYSLILIVPMIIGTMMISQFCFAQTKTTVVSRQWSVTVPALDTLLPAVSVVYDAAVYVASSAFTDSTTGVDIVFSKLGAGDGDVEWSVTYSSSGFYRDEATAITANSNFIYVGGYTYTDTLFRYAYVTLCFSATDGSLLWSQTYNGNYAHATDVITAMVANDDVVVVTGTSEDSVTSWDFVTIAYDANGGSVNWTDRFDNNMGYDAPYSIANGRDSDHEIIVGGATLAVLTG